MNSKTRVFIWGSCVSRDTFEHMDPSRFELVTYVARQSALSATTRPVEQIAAPQLTSRFQQRMISGDFGSNLRPLLTEQAATTDVLLVDLTDERLGVYLLPDGTVVTRSVELIESGLDQTVAQMAQHLPFGTQQHFEYWSGAIQAAGDAIRQIMPGVTVALLDIPWAEWSESGQQTPDSFGVTAAQANPVFRPYVETAVRALGAHLVSIDASRVLSGPNHPWGDAPFHYAENVYLDAVRQLTGAEGRAVWTPGTASGPDSAATAPAQASISSELPVPAASSAEPNLFIVGTQKGGTGWLHKQLGKHPDIFMSKTPELNFFSDSSGFDDDKKRKDYFSAFGEGAHLRYRGESTARYFWHTNGGHFSPRSGNPDVPRRIRDLVGTDITAIVSLRNPVERAVAGYWHHFTAGHFDLSTSIFQVPPERGILDFGFYERHYSRWAGAIGEERLHVVLYDDLVTDPAGTVTEVLRHLGLPAEQAFQDEVNIDEPPEPEHAWIDRFKRRRPIRPQEIAALHSLYKEEVRFVEQLLGRQLPTWHDVDAMVERLTQP